VSTPAALQPLRVLPAPVAEPHPLGAPRRPRGEHPPAQGVLPLRLSPQDLPGTDAFFAPQPTPSTALPDPAVLTRSLVQAVVEVLGGVRPAAQLLRWLSADVYAGVQRRAALAARIRGGRAPARRVVVRHVRVSVPRDGVAEAAVAVRDGDRVRAVALRLEGLDGRWRVTALEVG
jgi:Family of unknown function (DUF6459)